jgi:hypothetical protein
MVLFLNNIFLRFESKVENVTDRIHSTAFVVILNLLFSALLHGLFQCCMHSIQNEATTEVTAVVIALITDDSSNAGRPLFDPRKCFVHFLALFILVETESLGASSLR